MMALNKINVVWRKKDESVRVLVRRSVKQVKKYMPYYGSSWLIFLTPASKESRSRLRMRSAGNVFLTPTAMGKMNTWILTYTISRNSGKLLNECLFSTDVYSSSCSNDDSSAISSAAA